LLQLPIHNYLTLNYDAGLTNARTFLYPKATTSYYFWDQEEARQILDPGYKRLVLHVHGRYDRTDSIILTLNDYRRAYDNRAFVRLLDKIFAFEKLIIVGFGMTDPYIKELFNNISKDYKKSPPGHIAFVGLDDENLEVTHLLRERVEMVYGAKVLFYPARDNHKALTEWLTALAEKYAADPASRTVEEIIPLSPPPELKTALPDKYVHKPTDDENFKGRADDFDTLNRWANDPATRTIAITGIGGQGKTALVGRWLNHQRTPELAKMPVFYWSFYEDLDVEKFLVKLVEFCLPIVRIYGKQEIEPISFILQVVQKARLLLVLDGLEVLQEEADSPNHGRINHYLLEQLLFQWLRYKHQGLMVLTSRFHFPQLARYSGAGFHHLGLIRLGTKDGVSLLHKLGTLGEQHLLETYVEKLYGHPLALRVLASTVKRCCSNDLTQFNGDSILTAIGDDDKLSKKLRHLLSFYESQLINGQKELLGILSLFKRPVEIKSFITLLRNMKSLKDTPLANADEAEIEKQLDLLTDDFLVERTDGGITTHPVIRDHFRSGLNVSGSRREVADFLKARPGAERPQNIEEVRDLVEAVQLLCDEGEFKAAHDLLISRLSAGGYDFNVFKYLPAVAEGLECNLAFVGDETRRQKTEENLGKNYVAFYCSGVAFSNRFLGKLAQALEWWNKALEIYRQLKKTEHQASSLHNISLAEMEMGNIRQARETVSSALNLSHENRKLAHLATEFTYKAYYEFLLGNSSRAYQDFEIALYYEQKRLSDSQHLYSLDGNQQAEFLIRLGTWKQFEAVNAYNIQTCEEYHWNTYLAVCHLLQGWSEICRGQLPQAEKELNQAERILRPSGMVEFVCRLDWVWALLYEAKGEYEKGLQKVSDALSIATDKGYHLWHADILTLRGRLSLLQFEKENQKDSDLLEKAGDDANDALKIADQTGYVWPKVEALELLANYHKVRSALPAFNSQDENDLALRHTKEVASLKAGLFLTEEQMQQLKTQARLEFEKQTASWKK
jgi:tetratricopeptide (TPR) repeat protein